MEIDDIQQRMSRWADWVMRSAGGALGFPRECPYTRMMARGGEGFCSPEVDIESAETEKAVQSLDLDLKQAVQVFYLVTATRETQAKYLSCHVRTMERRVERAHSLIVQYLDEAKRQRRKKNLTSGY